MVIFGIHRILNWCSVFSNGRTYTCPIKTMNGELYFHFKKQWHKVAEYVSEYTRETIEQGGKIIDRPFKDLK